MEPKEARKQAGALLAQEAPERIAEAAAATGVAYGMGNLLKRLTDVYPDPADLVKAVLKGDKALKKKDADEVRASVIVLLAHLNESAALPLAQVLVGDENAWSEKACNALGLIARDEALDTLFTTAALPVNAKGPGASWPTRATCATT